MAISRSRDIFPGNGSTWKWVFLSILPVAIVSLSILYWYVKPTPGEVFLGFAQVEQPVYLVLSKTFAQEGSFVFYSSPYAVEDFPRIYTHLLPVILGGLWRLTGIPLLALWWLVRLVLGPLMFFLSFQILRVYVHEEKYLVPGAFLLAFGGGMAYLHALLGSLGSGGDFMTGWMLLERPYDWWFTNLFRVAYYPFEVFNHVLFFSSIYLFLKKRYFPSVIVFFLTWWAHPFTGAQLTAVYLAFFLVEISLYRRPLAKTALPFLGVALIFVLYYLVWIPSFPLAREIMASFRLSTSAGHLSPLLYPSAWGMFLFLPLLNGQGIFRGEKTRFLIYWVLVDLALINHDLLVQPGFQPMHFTRGYLFLPLAILSLLGIKSRLQDRDRASLVLLLLVVLSLPDNALFLYKFTTLGGDEVEVNPSYHLNPLRIKDSQWDILQRLGEREKQVVLASDNIINFLLPLYTDHDTLLGHPDYVPYFETKLASARRYFRTGDPHTLDPYGVTMAVHPRSHSTMVNSSKVLYENRDYIIVEIG